MTPHSLQSCPPCLVVKYQSWLALGCYRWITGEAGTWGMKSRASVCWFHCDSPCSTITKWHIWRALAEDNRTALAWQPGRIYLELLGGSVSVGVVQDGTANALASKLDVLAVVHCQPGFLPLPLQYENQLLLSDKKNVTIGGLPFLGFWTVDQSLESLSHSTLSEEASGSTGGRGWEVGRRGGFCSLRC